MSFWEHIAELRKRVVYSAVFVFAGFFIAYAFHKEIFDIMTVPVMKGLKAYGFTKLQAISVQEMIFVYFQQSLIFGIAIASPFILYQIWAFVAPGLYPKEKRFVIPVIFISTLFFIAGALFCYFVFLPLVVEFLVSFSVESPSVTVMPTVKNSYIVVLGAALVFGLLFELPIIMFFLALLRIINSRMLIKFSRYFVLIAFVVGGVLTPPDPISQILMAVPICLLYLIGLAAVYILELFRGGESSGKTARLFRLIAASGIVVIFLVAVGFALKRSAVTTKTETKKSRRRRPAFPSLTDSRTT
ncbi:MAG: twin-arginine translocase subunit TatC [Deltaproteobacteria bacterium]|nr:twin-arginine translocase subunit TatC [Deltaproteobacteria bacterium]